MAVRVVERVDHLAADADGVIDRELSFCIESVSERGALGARHNAVHLTGRFARVEQREDVRVDERSAMWS